jgi:hypothetical protein
VAALLSGRDAPLACEELALRSRADLGHDRPREAALQARAALDAALGELAAWGMEARLDELAGLRDGVADAAEAAIRGALEPSHLTTVAAAVERIEAALRARLARIRL